MRLRAIRPPQRRAGLLAILVLAGLIAAGPSLAARAIDAAVPSRVDQSSGSDRITEIVRQIRMVEAQLSTTRTRVATLTQRQARVTEELDAARTRGKTLAADLKAAKKVAATAATSLTSARRTLTETTRGRASAQEEFEDAERALAAAQDRLERVSVAADRAEATLRRASARLQDARSGSKAHRTAFTAWTMAAIDDRAAHARQVLADDRAADEFVGLQAAEAVLAEAEYAHQEARSARARAARAAEGADERVAALKAERAAVKAEAAALEPEATQLRTSLKAAKKRLATLAKQLEQWQRRAAEAGQQLAVAEPDRVAPDAVPPHGHRG